MTSQAKAKALKIIEEAIALHEKMKNSFFWSSPRSASARRSYEKFNTFKENFSFKKGKIVYDVVIKCNTTCSCNHIYYSGLFKINDNTCDIRGLKKLVKLLKTEIA